MTRGKKELGGRVAGRKERKKVESGNRTNGREEQDGVGLKGTSERHLRKNLRAEEIVSPETPLISL